MVFHWRGYAGDTHFGLLPEKKGVTASEYGRRDATINPELTRRRRASSILNRDVVSCTNTTTVRIGRNSSFSKLEEKDVNVNMYVNVYLYLCVCLI